ncbi:MAG: DNA polymerase III subunit beta [Candidatus Omnitrophota bacterium]
MKFKIFKDSLVESLQKVTGPTTNKQKFPILSSVLINCLDNKIKLTATDLDITIITLQEAAVIEAGQVAVPMKRFASIIREMPACEIVIENIKSNLLISCEKVEFKISTLNPDEFPTVLNKGEVSLIKINPQEFEEMIRLTSFCVGYEDTSYVLNGILFEINQDKINLVSTDGRRLAFIQRSLPVNQPEIKSKISFILPIKAVGELYKLIKEKNDDIYLFVDNNKIGFDFKNTQFVARPIEGEFPDYTQYIPEESKDKLVVSRKDMLFALRRASLFSTTDYQGVKLELKRDSMNIYKSTPQLGEVKESVDVKYSGAHMEVGFNPNYLIDILKNIEDENITMDFFSADKPAVLRRQGYIYLLLPMKV